MIPDEHLPTPTTHWPTIGVISAVLMAWGTVLWRGGGLVWKGASRMKTLEEAVQRLEIADRKGDEDNKQALDLLRSEFHEFRKEFVQARAARDEELRIITAQQNHVSTRIHERMDELSKGMNRIEGYLQAKAEK